MDRRFVQQDGANRAFDPEKIAWMGKQTCPQQVVDSTNVGRRDPFAGGERFPAD